MFIYLFECATRVLGKEPRLSPVPTSPTENMVTHERKLATSCIELRINALVNGKRVSNIRVPQDLHVRFLSCVRDVLRPQGRLCVGTPILLTELEGNPLIDSTLGSRGLAWFEFNRPFYQ